jgi:addiction module HigA family antidote
VSRVTLSRVINEHASISPNLARRLELAGIGTARLWLDMQTAKNLADEMAREQPVVQRLDKAV